MGQSAVTQERLDAAIRKLVQAAERGEFADRGSEDTPAQPGESPANREVSAAGGGGILQLAVSPETLLKLASSGTKELVISLTERD